MLIDSFVNDKINQLIYYLQALRKCSVHHTELVNFIWDTFEEWAQFNVTDDMPSSTKERVFWHLIHELKLGSLADLDQNSLLKHEIDVCLAFLKGEGNYPLHCVGWRPVL